MAFQNPTMLPWMTIERNIMLPLKIVEPFRSQFRKLRKTEFRDKANALLEQVGLKGFGNRYPWQLSGGMLQRANLCRALIHEPRMLLLDEPFGALDAKVRKDLRRWLRDVHERTGQTTVFVTHDQEEALELADRVAILNHGRLEQLGTPDEVYDSPASPFVMSFVGETSRIPVRLANGQVFYENRRLSLRPEGVADGPGDLYVRPWDLQLHAGDDADLVGAVQAVRRVGAVHRAEVAIGAGSVEVDLPAGASFPKGALIQVQILRGCVFAKTSRDSVTGPL